MGKHRRMPDAAPQATAIEDSGATYWSVDGDGWRSLRPSLPAEVADLLAPPIVVGVARVVATSRVTPSAGAFPGGRTGRHRNLPAPIYRNG